MKLAAAIQAKSVTSDSNAQNDSGAYLQFSLKQKVVHYQKEFASNQMAL